MGKLEGKVAIITGAGHGIGHGLAHRFTIEGARVLLADVDEAAAERVAAEATSELGGDARPLRVDVSRKDDVLAMVEAATDAWGTVDILVNNAWGGETFGGVEDKTDAALAHALAVAYYGPFWAMQAAFPLMKARQWGRIINMCSLAGVDAFVGTLEYNAAKEALRTLTRTAAREWAPHGIVVNAICPGAKASGLQRRYADDPTLEATLDAMNPMGRVGDPETDIGPVAVFLANDDCRYLTGNTLFVDGGTHINGSPWQPALRHSRANVQQARTSAGQAVETMNAVEATVEGHDLLDLSSAHHGHVEPVTGRECCVSTKEILRFEHVLHVDGEYIVHERME